MCYPESALINAMQPSFKGNKADLPSKICIACGKPMTWRKAWAKNWAVVKYCSDKCRRNKPVQTA
jgi:hypothetical protein